MKTAISLPDELFERAETAAKDLGVSRSKLVQVALEEFFQRRRDASVTQSIDRHLDAHGAQQSREDEAWLAHNRARMRRVEWKE